MECKECGCVIVPGDEFSTWCDKKTGKTLYLLCLNCTDTILDNVELNRKEICNENRN